MRQPLLSTYYACPILVLNANMQQVQERLLLSRADARFKTNMTAWQVYSMRLLVI